MEKNSWMATIDHIKKVQCFITDVIDALNNAAVNHDQSKLEPPEKEILDEMTPKLGATTYGSPEYVEMVTTEPMTTFTKHHYAHNRHHAEFHPNGVDDMNLIDVVEMLCDWKAASLRHDDGDVRASIDYNEGKYKIDPQLAKIFRNTVRDLKW